MGIPLFPGFIDTTNGSQEKGNMGVAFYRHEGKTRRFCKVGRNEEGSSFSKTEHAAACIALKDAIKYAGSQRPIFLL